MDLLGLIRPRSLTCLELFVSTIYPLHLVENPGIERVLLLVDLCLVVDK